MSQTKKFNSLFKLLKHCREENGLRGVNCRLTPRCYDMSFLGLEQEERSVDDEASGSRASNA